MERPKRKLAISGSGIDSCFAIGHFLKYSAAEIDWYIHDADSSFRLTAPNFVEEIHNHFTFVNKVNYNPIIKLNKLGCGTVHRSFYSTYAPSRHGYILDNKNYRDGMIKHIQKHNLPVNIKEQLTTHDIDCDYILDFTDNNMSNNITKSKYAVSKKIIKFKCSTDKAEYQFIVRPFGYVVLIPCNDLIQGLYYYDNDNNEDILDDISSLCHELGTENLEILGYDSLESFYRTQNFTDRVVYNGKAGFSLENIETANLSLGCYLIRCAFDYFSQVFSAQEANNKFHKKYFETERITMLYFAASNKFQLTSKYWKHAKWLAWQSIEELSNDPNFHRFSMNADRNSWTGPEYGYYSKAEYIRNVENLGLPINIEQDNNGNN